MSLATRSARCAALMAEPDELYPEKIIYPRNTRTLTKTAVVGGKPIDEKTCMALRTLVFGSCATPPRPEWARTGFTLRPYGQSLAFGLRAARNTTRSLVTAVQAVMLKHFLFKSNRLDSSAGPVESLLKPSYERQIDALTSTIAEIIWRSAGGFAVQNAACSSGQSGNENVSTAVVALPQEIPYVQHSVQYFQDGLTETLHLFEFESLDDLEIFIKRYLYLFQDEGSPGAALLLYSAVLSRGLSKVKIDLENPRGSMLSGCPEEGSISVVVFSLTGRASPHLHNGVLHVGDEDTYVSYLPLSSSLDFYFHRNRQGCAAMGSPGKERGRISGARGRRRIEQTTRLPLEDPQPADLGHPLPGSSRCPVQYEPRAAQKLPRGATVRDPILHLRWKPCHSDRGHQVNFRKRFRIGGAEQRMHGHGRNSFGETHSFQVARCLYTVERSAFNVNASCFLYLFSF
ncbi:probable ubiquitin carboxyl-terminal hydrolase MINDY-4 isoform X2 [Apis cerana]|uniref:probable ubiquitin carboxyl-terminal hydrolase MINDY-4 isoform X2 n=1 Tax=Apis cerana TaxID=7461 RepID=UPI00109BD68D|nr:probable ubiquitin carboxyl-terminal hydrolase MINDY-4 isoform X2 [Apis cerana]